MSNINITPFYSRGYEQQTISSREVAEMMEIKEHSKMIRKIEQINEVLNEAKIGLVEYWFESTYVDGKGETRKEYQVTKKGCEMLAHKSTGNKGILFTHKYMERFEQMKKAIQERNEKASLLLAIYEGGQVGVSASKRLVEIETQELSQQVQVMTPKAESYDQFIDADGTYSTTNACKMLGLNRAEVFKWLREKGLVYKKKTEATQKAVDKGYFKHVIKGGHSTMVITPKGIEFLRDTFLKQAS
ncbi:hypothetical protein GMB80_08155 [Turicibacter sanguinis]|nr:hypothetical protein [Turicibacter sanguinis]